MSMIWKPGVERISDARMTAFRHMVNRSYKMNLEESSDLQRFSLEQPDLFWSSVMEFCGFKGQRGNAVRQVAPSMKDTLFFPGTTFNYAQNLLQNRGEEDAIIFRAEDIIRSRLSWKELYARTARLHHHMSSMGLKQGDRVAAMMPNLPETIIALLAAASHGAVWSSCSPDFGESAVLSRFGQISPKILIVCDSYYYKGKKNDISEKVTKIIAGLPSVEQVLVVPYGEDGKDLVRKIGQKAVLLNTILDSGDKKEIKFVPVDFNDPLFILYSSGTTGLPKCIVHRGGGVLLQHLKEHQLHCDFRAGDRLLYFTTCGWMMWNWMVSALASGVTLLLYEGSPSYPRSDILFDYLEEESATCFGTSGKFIDMIRKSGLSPIKTHDLSVLSTILSTGSPLAPSSFDYVYTSIEKDVHLASISGGTDICGCFVMGDPTCPVYRGEIQGKALGMDVQVYSPKGEQMLSGKGELVCSSPFPSMPIGFWNDPDRSRYEAAYFKNFPGVWYQGDFAELTGHGGFILHGRSDATLKPGGVRIGTAELYAEVENIDGILESVAIGQQWGGDERVVLFVKLRDDCILNKDLEDEIRTRLRVNLSPRHVPEKIIQIQDIPRTRSGKISEIAVHDAVHGQCVRQPDALSNPETLLLYRDIPELRI